jgi:hypothetical protein
VKDHSIPLFNSLVTPIQTSPGLLKLIKKDKTLMAINLNNISAKSSSTSNQTVLSVIFNKGAVKTSKKRSDVEQVMIHNGSITGAYDTGKFFANFRMVSEKQGEVPMFVTRSVGRKVEEIQISSKTFMDKYYGGKAIDTKFYFNITEDAFQEILDTNTKAIKISWVVSPDAIVERKDEEYKGNSISVFTISNPQIETLDQYFGIGRRVDHEHILNIVDECIEEVGPSKKPNTVTAADLKEKAEKMTVNGKKNAIRKLLKEIEEFGDLTLIDEFKSFSFSSVPDTFNEQLDEFKNQLVIAKKGVKVEQEEMLNVMESAIKNEPESDSDDESKPLSAEQQAAFLASLLD